MCEFFGANATKVNTWNLIAKITDNINVAIILTRSILILVRGQVNLICHLIVEIIDITNHVLVTGDLFHFSDKITTAMILKMTGATNRAR